MNVCSISIFIEISCKNSIFIVYFLQYRLLYKQRHWKASSNRYFLPFHGRITLRFLHRSRFHINFLGVRRILSADDFGFMYPFVTPLFTSNVPRYMSHFHTFSSFLMAYIYGGTIKPNTLLNSRSTIFCCPVLCNVY